MVKKGAPTLFNPKPSRPTLPKKESQATNTPSPGSSQSLPGSQSAPGTPKKPVAATASPANRATGTAPRRAPPVKTEDEVTPQPPQGPSTDYRLMSSKLNGWKYDVMKFESRKKVEINDWARPVKLNRKDLHRNEGVAQASQEPVHAMVGSDGKLVVGADGKVVMVDAAGRPIRHEFGEGKEEKGKDKDKDSKKKRFQKKTKQVFLVPEATRQLRREEKFPWVVEDATGKETWVAQMEEVSKSQTHAMFMPSPNNEFKFVPAHRWYKFQKKAAHHVVKDINEVESIMTKAQKRKDKTLWTLRQKTEEAAASGSSLVHNASQSLGPGGRKLRTVDSGSADLFGDDEEEGVDRKRKIKRELGAEGFLDELDFEEGFEDDEQNMEPDDSKEDDEAKELEERLKREYKTANKLREGYIDESEEEDEDEAKLTGAGKNLQKTLKKLEKGGGYEDDSDEEKNPYASSEEEEEEEETPQLPTGPAILPPEPKPGAPAASQTPSASLPGAKPAQANGQGMVPVKSESRATSPVPGHGGHSVVAKRATSPKVPRPKAGISSRAGSPLVAPNGVSPPASRATSPSGTRADGASPAGAATPGTKPLNLKRKATEEGAGAGADGTPRPKKRKAPGELEDRMVIEWLRNTPNATTRECIQHFTRYLTDEAKKSKFTALVKEVAQLSGGVLVLRPAYRGTSGPSPPAAG